MFRKKDSDADFAGGESAFRRPAGEAPAKNTAQPDLPRRKVDLPAGAGGGNAQAAAGPMMEPASDLPPERPDSDRYGGKRLIVGEGIRLSGEISSCDRLVVEGEVEVTLNDTLALEIASMGRFTGGCEVEEADISGVYEGDLTVRGRLFVRGTGRLTGTIRYGELELQRGGQIAGNISVLSPETGASIGGPSGERARPAPRFAERTPPDGEMTGS